MKKLIAFAFLLLCATPCYPQDSGAASVDYGTRFNILPGSFTTKLDRSYLYTANTRMLMGRELGAGKVQEFPVWSPDGKRIAYSDLDFIFTVPSEGGTPEMVFDGVYLHSYNDGQLALSRMIVSLIGFSPDGEKLYFNFMESDPASITVEEDGLGMSAGASRQIRCVERLDLTTGAMETVLQNASGWALSSSGRYLGYYDDESGQSRIKDLTTSEVWAVPADCGVFCFIPDEKSILYFKSASGELFKAPLKGGVPVQIASLEGRVMQRLDCSPDGKWALCEEYIEDIVSSHGTHWLSKATAINLHTGEKVEVLPPVENINPRFMRFSPDGKKICYTRYDWKNEEHDFGELKGTWRDDILYVKNISLPAWDQNQQVSVADAAPKGFALTGNYPNPFNPSTHIAFTLPSSGTAQLSVYDVTGRKVRDLVSSTLSAGTHEMVWDGRDESGAAASSGTYIARLKMGAVTASHRMTLMK